MKVFIINSMFKFGSTGRIVFDMSSILTSSGNEVMICYGLGKKSQSQFKAFKVSNRFDYYLHNFFARAFDKTGLLSWNPTRKIIKKIKAFSPDIIQIHNIHGYWLNYKTLFKFLASYNVPVVWTLHDSWAFTGRCAHFAFSKCDKWMNGCGKCQFKYNYPKSWFFDCSRQNFKIKKKSFTSITNMTIVTPSLWLAENAKKSFLSKYKILTINNGIDLNLFKRTTSLFKTEQHIQNKKIVLAVANNWDQKKGLFDLIKLSNNLSNNFCLVVVGTTKEQASSFHPDTICIEKTTNIQQLAQIYSAADVFINLTYEDTFPTVNIEALACGTPIITYNTGGSPEIIDEYSGIVVEQGNINGVIKSLDLIGSLTRHNCVERAKKFEKKERYEEYFRLYKSIVEKDT